MSDEMPPEDLTAAELALGLLDGAERAAALRRVLAEPAFAAEVEMWRTHFGQLFDLWPEAAPPADGLARLERALDAPIAQPAAPPIRSTGRLWPALTAASSLIAACLLLFVAVRPPVAPIPPAPHSAAAPMLVAAVMPSEKGEPATVVYHPDSGHFMMTEAAMGDASHSAQLWVIGGDGVPHSLGLMAHGKTEMALPPPMQSHMTGGAIIAVSLEPMGGSPTGQPTGPVIAKGALSQA